MIVCLLSRGAQIEQGVNQTLACSILGTSFSWMVYYDCKYTQLNNYFRYNVDRLLVKDGLLSHGTLFCSALKNKENLLSILLLGYLM
jgi:hypothetical protein